MLCLFSPSRRRSVVCSPATLLMGWKEGRECQSTCERARDCIDRVGVYEIEILKREKSDRGRERERERRRRIDIARERERFIERDDRWTGFFSRAVVVFHTNRLIPPPPPSPLADAACFPQEENYFFRLLNTRWEFIINTDGVSAILKYSPHIYTVCPTTPNCRILYYYYLYV